MNSSLSIKMGNETKTWLGLDGMPKTITFSVTQDCNLACKYCYMTGKNHIKKMSFETAKKTIDYILSNKEFLKAKSVIWEFIGGEPFLEIELIDKMTDYIKQQMFLLDHPWFNSYRLAFSSNGLLYGTPTVQKYIKKNHNHLSIGLSVDGNKIKHDLQRVRLDGTGSYDDVVKNVPLWLSQFPNNSTKATFSHADIPYLKDSIINLWKLGIKVVYANVVFEDVWEEGDDLLMEQQLKELADYVLEHELWKEYSVKFFDPNIGKPLSKEEAEKNSCGSGKMLAIDCDGNFVPCTRFFDISLNHKKARYIGNADIGINQDMVRPFLALNVSSQSKPECVKCEVASGCTWCQGCNYDMAETDTIYQRATYICKMHKATVRANKYFWNKFESVTGLPSKRREKEYEEGARYLQFITSDSITPHCAYHNTQGTTNVMSPETFKKGMEFCIENNYIPAFLGRPQNIDRNKYEQYIVIDKAGEGSKTIAVYDNEVDSQDESSNGILLLNKNNLNRLFEMLKTLFAKLERVNLVVQDLDIWNNEDIKQYTTELDKVVDFVADKYKNGREIELNVLTDIWNLTSMRNCDAGNKSFSLAPNGKIYICPAFYFDDPDYYVGTLEEGINIKNPQLLELENAPICTVCDVYSCNRCKYYNKKMTNEINTPSKIECVIKHVERTESLKLQKMLRELGFNTYENVINEVDYDDPLEKLLKIKER